MITKQRDYILFCMLLMATVTCMAINKTEKQKLDEAVMNNQTEEIAAYLQNTDKELNPIIQKTDQTQYCTWQQCSGRQMS